jgi:hypothetical protein
LIFVRWPDDTADANNNLAQAMLGSALAWLSLS